MKSYKNANFIGSQTKIIQKGYECLRMLAFWVFEH